LSFIQQIKQNLAINDPSSTPMFMWLLLDTKFFPVHRLTLLHTRIYNVQHSHSLN